MVDCVWQCISPFLASNYFRVFFSYLCIGQLARHEFLFFVYFVRGEEWVRHEEPYRNRIGKEVTYQHIIAEISSFFNDLECDHNQESNAEWRSPNFPQYLFLFFLGLQHCRRDSMHLYKIKSPHCRDICRQLLVFSVVLRF